MTAINPALAAAIATQGVPLSADLAPLTAEREAEIREHIATTKNFSIGNLAARDLLAELDAVRKERNEARARVRELERPAVEAKRNEIRDSYHELVAVCEETKDYEGAFDVQCRLREREEQWQYEDEEAAR